MVVMRGKKKKIAKMRHKKTKTKNTMTVTTMTMTITTMTMTITTMTMTITTMTMTRTTMTYIKMPSFVSFAFGFQILFVIFGRVSFKFKIKKNVYSEPLFIEESMPALTDEANKFTFVLNFLN